MKPQTIFLCYASEDREKVRAVYEQLQKNGFNPWMDKEDLLPGENWRSEIPRVIRESDFILIFFSKTSVGKRGYVQTEFNLALDVLTEIPDGHIFVIPVRLDDCEIPSRFEAIHHCDLFEKPREKIFIRDWTLATTPGMTAYLFFYVVSLVGITLLVIKPF